MITHQLVNWNGSALLRPEVEVETWSNTSIYFLSQIMWEAIHKIIFFNQYVHGLITFREPVQLDLTRGEALPGIVIVTHNIDNQIDCHIITLRGQGFHQIAKKNSTENTAWQFLSSHLGATGSGISPGLGVVNTRPARWPARFPSRRCFCKPSQYQYQDPITSSFKLTVWCEESWGLTKTDWGWRSS